MHLTLSLIPSKTKGYNCAMEGGHFHTIPSNRKRLRLPISQDKHDKNKGTESIVHMDAHDDNRDDVLMTPTRLNKRRRFGIRGEILNGGSQPILYSLLKSNNEDSSLSESNFVSDDSFRNNNLNNNMHVEPEQTSTIVSTPSFGNISSDGDTEICIGENACNLKLVMRPPCTRASGSRIGLAFQCENFPVAGSYLTDESDPIVE